MKYAVTGPRGRIRRTSDTEPATISPSAIVVQLSDTDAALVDAADRGTYWYIDGQLMTSDDRPVTDELKDRAKATIASNRYDEEMAGYDFNGIFVKTDERTRVMLSAAMIKIAADPNYQIDNWKLADGTFGVLNAATISAIYDSFLAHVASCFDKESSLFAQIDAATTVGDLNVIVW